MICQTFMVSDLKLLRFIYPNKGGGSTSFYGMWFAGTHPKAPSQTGSPDVPIGDVDYLVVRPMVLSLLK